MSRLLVVEDDAAVRTTVVTFLELEGYSVDAVASTSEALERLSENSYPIVISDIYIDDRTGLDVLDAARNKDPECSVILMTARGTMETVMAATRGGAFDYVAKPFEIDRMLDTIKRAEAARQDKEDDKENVAGPDDLPESEMIGSSAAMVEIYKTASLVAPTDATVLIEGETGTGKEVVARALHRLSLRAERPFVVLNCAAIPESLLEAELFGHTRGAFTGAVKARMGRIEMAHGGTLLLDEIGEMPLGMQAKMLRFLESGELQRVGDNQMTRVDVRLIAATHQPLEQRSAEGTFRLDLYHRLAVFPIEVPPLRERMEDIAALTEHILERLGMESPHKRLAPAAAARLHGHTWPGNVRELMHVLERGAILAGAHPEIAAADIRYRRTVRS